MSDLIDSRFGVFTWDAVLQQFLTEYGGVWLHVQSAQTLVSLHDLFADIDTLLVAAIAHASKLLLTERNGMFSEEEKISSAQFGARLTLEGLSLDDDGTLSLSFDDGGVFHNHIVIVDRDATGTWRDAYWAG